MQSKWALLEGAWSAEYVPHIRARKVSYLWEGALHVLYTWVTEYCQGRKTRPAASNHKYCFSSIWLARARARPLSPPRGKWFEFFMSVLPAFISGLGQVCCLTQYAMYEKKKQLTLLSFPSSWEKFPAYSSPVSWHSTQSPLQNTCRTRCSAKKHVSWISVYLCM